MALGTNYCRASGPPKPGYCEIGLVTQGRCRRKATKKLNIGLKKGPINLCAPCADHVCEVLGAGAKPCKE